MEEQILESIYGSYVLLGTLIREAVDKKGYKKAVGYGSRTSVGPEGEPIRQIRRVAPKKKSGGTEPPRKPKSFEKQHRPAR